MDTVITILTNIIDEQGVEYLQRSPYAVYQKLISEKARSDYARLVLITLLCNASVKAGEMDEAALDEVRQLYREAQWFWDYCYVENSEGAHNSTLAKTCLDTSEEKIIEAMEKLSA